MITLEDCAAFCDADPGWVDAVAQRDQLAPVLAYACCHEATLCANDSHLPPALIHDYRHVA